MKARRDVFQALADPARRAILILVSVQGPLSPGTIAEHFNSTRQTISKHIQILAECNLLSANQKGREIYYQFNPQKMKEAADYLEQFRAQWEKKFNVMDNILLELKNK